MSLEQEVEVLRQIPLFAKIDPARLKLMAFASERLTFKPGQVLIRQGEAGDCAYIIVGGKALVLRENPDGERIALAEPGKNSIIGEIAILCDVPRTATVEAKEELTTLKITRDIFFRMVRDFPDIGIEVMRLLAQRLEMTSTALAAAKAAH